MWKGRGLTWVYQQEKNNKIDANTARTNPNASRHHNKSLIKKIQMRMKEQESSMNNKETRGDAAGEKNDEATITTSYILKADSFIF